MTGTRSRLALILLMTLQAALGLALPGAYRDVAWIRATWFGNDLVTLVLAAPLLAWATAAERRDSERARLVGLGVLGYAAYNYGFYLLGAELNVFFPLYVAATLLAAVTLGRSLVRLDPIQGAAMSRGRSRTLGGWFVFVAAGLTVVWFGTWAAYVFAGRPLPVESTAFRLVAALDLTVMVPALLTAGVLLWRRHPWAPVAAAIAGIQGSLYLLVLALNAVVLVARGLRAAPGELPIWGPLAVANSVATVAALASARGIFSRHERLRLPLSIE
ncbi:MAG TPA: hypothetical protein VEA99_00980 [Gemmatimonadaceae bacterium]|nr:hypothetical protein [Gemmatimonadaceae bacterium]